MQVARIVLAVVGVAAIGWGVKMFVNAPTPTLIGVGTWMVAAVIIHDGLLSPAVLGIAALLRRLPARGRRFVQAALIMAGCVTVVAVPMIIKQGSYPPAKALLEQRYDLNLVILLALIGVGTLIAYAIRVARDQHRPRSARA